MRALVIGIASAALAAAASTNSAPPTFYKDVLPVLQKNCQNCHRPGEAGPMSFMSYESTRPWAKAIKTAVATKKMPPWFADPHYGKFENDRSLSQAEMQTLTAWVDAGAKAGEATDAPKPVEFTDGWGIPKPDVILSMPAAFAIPASGTVDYQYFIVPTNFKEDRYVQYAEARPSNRVLVHHIIAFVREPGSPWLKEAKPGIAFVPSRDSKDRGEGFGGDFLAGYAPGTIPQSLKPGQAKLIKAGSDIVLQIHYTANGKTGTDTSRVALVFAKEKPTQRVLTLASANGEFAIPAGDSNYRVESKIQLQEKATLISFLPHMHLRGKDFEYRAIYPTGETEKLLVVPHYSFSWQLTYNLEKPKVLPAGTVIECTAHFDNSANNAANPDATKVIHFGEQSWDEMMIGFFDVAVDVDTTPMDLLRPKKKATGGD